MVSMSVAVRNIRSRHSGPPGSPHHGGRRPARPVDGTGGRPRGSATAGPDTGPLLLTSGLDGLAHDISAEEWTQGSRSGRYRTECGGEAVAVSLHHPPGPRCPACAATSQPGSSARSQPASRRRVRLTVRWLQERLASEEHFAEQAGWKITRGRWGSRTYRDPRFDSAEFLARFQTEGTAVR